MIMIYFPLTHQVRLLLMTFKPATIAFALALLLAPFAHAESPVFELHPHDHIVLIGNELADRFQHTGWFETYVQAKYPGYDLVFRDLATPADEITTWHRSENFGSRDEWLTKTKADVIFAFYGFNESFRGPEGLVQFRADLHKFLKDTLAKNYSGSGHPRIVLFSPIANERTQDLNFRDPTANNLNLAAYTAAMKEVATANGVPFVDLFAPSQTLFSESARHHQSLTIDGLHLSTAGDKLIAQVMFKNLFGNELPTGNAEVKSIDLEKLRAAVLDKNEQWHARYRTIDGYNVYGGRSALAYAPGKDGFIYDRNAPAPYVSNFKVMQQEMSQRDVMTANRDRRVWARAQGSDFKVEDTNLPPVTKVETDFPGPNADKSFPFLSGAEAISKMTVHAHMKVNLFASEEQFPELVNPVQMAWDTKGRLWVAVWKNYPERAPDSKVGDSLIVLEDTKGTGHADKVTHYIDDLNAPTGFQFYKDGVLLMQAPDLWFLRDANHDGRADVMERVLMGMDSADSHHTANSICLDPGGGIYLSDGIFHRTQVETALGPVRNNDGAIYRFEPRTGRFEVYASYGFANPHGRVFNYWGDDIITDATGNNSYFAPAFTGHIDYPEKHATMKQFWDRPSRPCAGTGLISSRQFPDDMQGDFMDCNVISFQGIYLVKVTPDGSGLKGETIDPLVSSSDGNFRPVAVNIGPDGAIYFADWQKPIIGHMQHHLRDPNRDHDHGRIYRITYEGRPLLKQPKIDGARIPALLDLLKEPENRTRELAKIELGKHDSAQVIAAVNKWAAKLDTQDPAYEHNLMEALWVHQWHNVVDVDLLKRMLHSPEPRARAAAGRVLCYWRDRVPDALESFRPLAEDENARVRLEAIRDMSFFNNAEAANIALLALKHPTDYYIDYTLKETIRQLEPYWRKSVADGKPIATDNSAGFNYLVHSISTAELLKMPHTAAVELAILTRPDAQDQDRMVALLALEKSENTNRVGILLDEIESNRGEPPVLVALAHLLPMQPVDQLKTAQSRIVNTCLANESTEVRQAGWAALAVACDEFSGIWRDASQSPGRLVDFLKGIPLIPDPELRAKAYDLVKPLLDKDSSALQALVGDQKSNSGRYVRIELPREGTLTLAEVQVFSDGKNIALEGKATQSTTANGGVASRAIDGRTDGAWSSGTQTHTKEAEKNPWWEVDLGSPHSIDNIVVWNRIDDVLGHRLDGFTLTVLDANRHDVFKKTGIPAPVGHASFAIGGSSASALRRAAIRALVSMNHEPAAVFAALTGMITRGEEVPAAARGMRVLPRTAWTKSDAATAATALTAWSKSIPAGDRTTSDYIETEQLAEDLAGSLPPDQSAALRKDLHDLRVAVFLIRTVREQMRYDTPRLVVEAGKPFEVRFENGDFMPHNFVIVKPGTRAAVGELAAKMKPDQLDSSKRAYIPATPDILAATKLLNTGDIEALKLTAPSDEGDYEYVCTFPGHYQVMWGTLVVSKDVDNYLQNHPQVASASAAPHEHHHDADTN